MAGRKNTDAGLDGALRVARQVAGDVALMDYYSAVKHRPDCPRCGHRMVHAVGSSIKGNQWIRWWCPNCGHRYNG